jgi:type IV conjugative transfer system protein TraL
MWTPCPTHLDDPVLILGLEPEDYGLVMLTLILAGLVVNALLAFASAVGVGLVFWALKRGHPPGTLIHTLHRLELLPIRGVLRPRVQRYSPW